MKGKTIILLSLFFILSSCVSNKTSITQFSNVDINLNDGKVINGKLDFPILIDQKEIYIKLKKNKTKKIQLADVSKINYYLINDTLRFEKTFIAGDIISEKTKNLQLLQLLSKGKVNLYLGHNIGFVYTQRKKERFIQKTNLLFCKKKNETVTTLLYYQTQNQDEKVLKKIALDFFSDDESAQEKIIKTKLYNSDFLIKFIKTYNNENQ
ncbi:MAG: hypothetical protein V4548_13090 [Bacteroidota bacterium]